MKIMTLNVWGGRIFQELLGYVRQATKTVEVFCFQEVFSTITDRTWTEDGQGRCNLFSELCGALWNFRGVFHADSDKCDFMGAIDYHLSIGLATFVHRHISLKNQGDMFVFLNRNKTISQFPFSLARTIQFVEVGCFRRRVLILNLHGLWNGHEKTDTPERIEQSRRVRWLLEQYPGEKVLCGDFNLNPDTSALAILEGACGGMRNLIKEYGITSTRSAHYGKPGKYADYMLISSGIKVKSFRADDAEVSDHLPLILEIE